MRLCGSCLLVSSPTDKTSCPRTRAVSTMPTITASAGIFLVDSVIRAGALHDEHELPLAGADRHRSPQSPGQCCPATPAWSRLVVLHVQRLDDEQLLAVEHLVLLGRDDVTGDSGEKHTELQTTNGTE